MHCVVLSYSFSAMMLVSVAAKHKETKQFFTMYNTLEDTKVYLEKEVCKSMLFQ